MTRRKTGRISGRLKAISIKNLSNGASGAKSSSGIENISTGNQAQVEWIRLDLGKQVEDKDMRIAAVWEIYFHVYTRTKKKA